MYSLRTKKQKTKKREREHKNRCSKWSSLCALHLWGQPWDQKWKRARSRNVFPFLLFSPLFFTFLPPSRFPSPCLIIFFAVIATSFDYLKHKIDCIAVPTNTKYLQNFFELHAELVCLISNWLSFFYWQFYRHSKYFHPWHLMPYYNIIVIIPSFPWTNKFPSFAQSIKNVSQWTVLIIIIMTVKDIPILGKDHLQEFITLLDPLPPSVYHSALSSLLESECLDDISSFLCLFVIILNLWPTARDAQDKLSSYIDITQSDGQLEKTLKSMTATERMSTLHKLCTATFRSANLVLSMISMCYNYINLIILAG